MEGEKSVGDLSGVLGNILSDPAQMAKLTQLAGALASSGGLGALLGGAMPTKENASGASPSQAQTANIGSQAETQAEGSMQAQMPEVVVPPPVANVGAANASTADTITSALAKLSGGMGKAHTTKHEALLRALRPYLSNERQSRIDGLLRLLTLVNVLGGVLQTTQEEAASPRTP